VYLFGGETQKAVDDLTAARKINSRDELTLARLASIYHTQKRETEYKAIVKEVESFNAKPAVFYYELAERLEQRRFYHEAEKFFQDARQLQPDLPWPQNGLGLLYMRLGKEDEARKILDKAFDLDGFNVRVSNTLKVLDHLAKYETLKTKHFHIRFDPKNDRV